MMRVRILFCLGLLILSLYRLESIPPFWWDEGWTMNLAKNWVESGHYGQINTGIKMDPGLAAAFPVIAPIAASFKFFGVGVWQGRLPGIFYLWGTLALMFFLAKRLVNTQVAWLTLFFLVLLPPTFETNPILIGRQALGEMPMMFYLLAGYALLLVAFERRAGLVVLAGVSWGLAISSKAQPLPFWLFSICLCLALLLYKGHYQQSFILITGFLCAIVVWQGSSPLQWYILGGQSVTGEVLTGLLDTTAYVPDWQVRLLAWRNALAYGLGVVIFTFIVGIGCLRTLRQTQCLTPPRLVHLCLFGFTSSWLAWYLGLAMAWPRYLFPALLVGCLFAAEGFEKIRNRMYSAILATLVITYLSASFLAVLAISFPELNGDQVYQTADFLNRHTPPGSVIETYESSLIFLLKRSWHYPVDQVHIELNRRTWIDPDWMIDYDPLVADPDYIVIGPMEYNWKLYTETVKSMEWRLEQEFHPYYIYHRIR
jgi:hypothetical protein